MFKKKASNKNDLQAGINQFCKEHCQTTLPYNLDDEYMLYIEKVSKFKTLQQNSLFHSLISELFKTGITSYQTETELKEHYKEIAGLKEVKRLIILKDFTRKCLFSAIKLLPIEDSEKQKIYKLLNGESVEWHSWADATKEQATKAINQLINDCISVDVYNAYNSSSKIRMIIDELNEINNYII